MKYRIDFTRLARTEDEIQKNVIEDQFFNDILSGRPKEVYSSFMDSMPDGHIFDYKIINEKEGFAGIDILKYHIHPVYPEAKITSWDCYKGEQYAL